MVVYRRTRAQMPAHDFEVQEATEEGVVFRWLSTIQRADGDRICIERMVLDERGRRNQPANSRHSRRTLSCSHWAKP